MFKAIKASSVLDLSKPQIKDKFSIYLETRLDFSKFRLQNNAKSITAAPSHSKKTTKKKP
jgi:hypothetical protein